MKPHTKVCTVLFQFYKVLKQEQLLIWVVVTQVFHFIRIHYLYTYNLCILQQRLALKKTWNLTNMSPREEVLGFGTFALEKDHSQRGLCPCTGPQDCSDFLQAACQDCNTMLLPGTPDLQTNPRLFWTKYKIRISIIFPFNSVPSLFPIKTWKWASDVFIPLVWILYSKWAILSNLCTTE